MHKRSRGSRSRSRSRSGSQSRNKNSRKIRRIDENRGDDEETRQLAEAERLILQAEGEEMVARQLVDEEERQRQERERALQQAEQENILAREVLDDVERQLEEEERRAWRGDVHPFTAEQQRLLRSVGQEEDIPYMGERPAFGPINIQDHTDQILGANRRLIDERRREIEELERENAEMLADRRRAEFRQMIMTPIRPVMDAVRGASASFDHTRRNIFSPATNRILSSAANLLSRFGEEVYNPILRQRISRLRNIRNLGPAEVSRNYRHANALEAILRERQSNLEGQRGGKGSTRRKTRRSARKSTRKSARKSERKTRRSTRKSVRKTARKSARKTRRSARRVRNRS